MKNAEQRVASAVAKLGLRQPTDSAIRVAPTDREVLLHWIRAPTTPQRVVRRSRIVLLALDCVRTQEIAARLGVSRTTVTLWVRRFGESGPEALLHDAPGRGRPKSIPLAAMCDRLRQANLLGPDDRPLSIRGAAAFLGVSASSVWRTLKKPFPPRRHLPSGHTP